MTSPSSSHQQLCGRPFWLGLTCPCRRHHPPLLSFPNPSHGGEGTGLLGTWTGAWGGGASREHRAQQGPGRLSQPDVCVKVQPWATSPDAAHNLGSSLAQPSPAVLAAPGAGESGPLGGARARSWLQRAARADSCCLRWTVGTHPLTCGRETGGPRGQFPGHLSIY